MVPYVISLSALMGIILIIRAAFRKSVSPRIVYALWLIVLVRMLVPFSLFTVRIQLPDPVSTILTPAITDQIDEGKTIDHPGTVNEEGSGSLPSVNSETDPGRSTSAGGPSVKSVLLTIWAAGSAAIALFFVISGTRFRLRLKRSGRETDDFRGVPVYISGCVSVPSVVGVFSPVIFIPEEIEDEKARELILTHEYVHLRHGDQVWSFMRMLAVVIHWWNPSVWVSAIMSKRDSELACDDSVASKLSREDRYYYARLLLESIPMKRPFALGFGSAPMKERIFMLTDNFKNRSRAVIATVLLLSFAFCAFGCSFASAAVDGSGERSGSPDTIIIDPDDTQAPDSEHDAATNNPVEVQPYDPFEHTVSLTDDPESKRLYVFNESLKLSQTIGDAYPSDYAGQYYGDDGNLHINVTSMDNTEYYTDIIDGSIIKFDLVEFSLIYLKSLEAKVISYAGQKYGIYSVGIQQKINKVVISTSYSGYIGDIAAALSDYDKNSYEIIASSDTKPDETPAEGTTRAVENLDPETVTTPTVTEQMKKVIKSFGNLEQTISNTPFDELPKDYAGSYQDYKDKDDPHLHVLVTSLDNIDYYKGIVDESVTLFHVVDFSLWDLLEVQHFLNNEVRIALQSSGIYVGGLATIDYENNKVIISTAKGSDYDEMIVALLKEASIDENCYEIVKHEIEVGIIPQ